MASKHIVFTNSIDTQFIVVIPNIVVSCFTFFRFNFFL